MTKARSNATAPNAKGTLVVGNGTDASTTLAVASTAGYVLTVDSAEATGLKWASASSTPTFVGCSATDSGDQNINNTTATVVTWNTESFDTDGFHSTTTNTGRLTIPTGKTGYYQINARARWDENASNQRTIWVQKNGTTDVSRMDTTPSTNYPGSTQSFIVYLTAGDYIQMIAYQESGGTRLLRKTNQAGVFDIYFIGA